MSRDREMRSEEHERQADAFLRYLAKDRSSPAEETFRRWADSKDFTPADRTEIRAAVSEALTAGGSLTLTDPLDFLGAPEREAVREETGRRNRLQIKRRKIIPKARRPRGSLPTERRGTP